MELTTESFIVACQDNSAHASVAVKRSQCDQQLADQFARQRVIGLWPVELDNPHSSRALGDNRRF